MMAVGDVVLPPPSTLHAWNQGYIIDNLLYCG